MFMDNKWRPYICHQQKVLEGDRIFDWSEAEVKYSVTFQNLKAGGKNIWPLLINNKQYCLIFINSLVKIMWK